MIDRHSGILTALVINSGFWSAAATYGIVPPAPPGCPTTTHHFETSNAVAIPGGPAVVTDGVWA